MLTARSVTVRRGGRTVLDGVDLTVRPGELLGVIGPNGAGKSTLLQVLSNALSPDAGTVALDGRPLGKWSRSALARRRAVLPQAPIVAFPFRARDVVALGRSPHAGLSSRERDRELVAAALHDADAAHLAERAYDTLSGGERQRVHLARVLAQVWAPPDDGGGACYLLLDEPTNNLDLAHQHALLAQARRFARRGHGVLAILHDPNLAASYADRIAVLQAGRIAAVGAPAEVMTPALLQHTFGLAVEVLERPAGPLIVPMPEPETRSHTPKQETSDACSSP
jgi:iron complex transport system ATP-binding protein